MQGGIENLRNGENIMYLFFDTETTGKDPHTARMVQLAWSCFNSECKEIESKAVLIQPNGFEIPEDTTAIHGITTKMATDEGIPLKEALVDFMAQLKQVEFLIAHNIAYDIGIIRNELKREELEASPLLEIRKVCTMKQTTEFCKLPGYYGYKWPRLEELHTILFNSSFDGAHDAKNDVRACAACYFKLKEEGVIK